MNVKKGIIALLIFPLFIISMMPLSVHAENVSGDSPIIGVNINITDYEYSKIPVQATVTFETNQTRWQCMSSHSSMGCQVWQSQNTSGTVQNDITGRISYTTTGTVEGYLYEYDFVFDAEYVGYVVFANGSIGGTTTTTYYVNGSHLYLTSTMLITTFSISSYNLRRNDNTFAWNYPVESFTAVQWMVDMTYDQIGIQDLGNYTWPVYQLATNDIVIRQVLNPANPLATEGVLIFGIDRSIYNQTTLDRYVTIENRTGSVNIYWEKTIYRANYSPFSIVRCRITNNSESNTADFNLKVNQDSKLMPIYTGFTTDRNISMDFALRFDLTNGVIDDIGIIADGTTNSNSSVSSADQQNDTFKDQSSDLITQEEEFTSNMKQNLQQIDTSFTFNNFGNKFMSSAVWVRDQYDNMITNTPFGTLVTFSMLLGLGLLIIGRTVNK